MGLKRTPEGVESEVEEIIDEFNRKTFPGQSALVTITWVDAAVRALDEPGGGLAGMNSSTTSKRNVK